MRWQMLIAGEFERMSSELDEVLDGLTLEDLHKRPAPGANPIGWLAWHITRGCDRMLGDVVLGEQLWLKDGWHKKFNRPADYNDTGHGHTDAQVDALEIPDIKTLLAYHRAVMKPLISYVEGLTEAELGKQYPDSQHPGKTQAAGIWLVRILNNSQHVGEAAYARGLIKGHRWSGR